MKRGWVKLWRKILDNEELMRSNGAYKLFTVLLLLVNKKTGKWSGGRFQLSKISFLKSSNTYKALKRLQKLKIVTLRSNNQYTTISICNWLLYQGNSNTKVGQRSNNGVTTEGHSNKNKELKNREVHKKNQIKLLKNEIELLKGKFPTKDINNELEKANDWLLASGKKYKDYLAFFRNWLRRSPDTNKSHGGGIHA